MVDRATALSQNRRPFRRWSIAAPQSAPRGEQALPPVPPLRVRSRRGRPHTAIASAMSRDHRAAISCADRGADVCEWVDTPEADLVVSAGRYDEACFLGDCNHFDGAGMGAEKMAWEERVAVEFEEADVAEPVANKGEPVAHRDRGDRDDRGHLKGAGRPNRRWILDRHHMDRSSDVADEVTVVRQIGSS